MMACSTSGFLFQLCFPRHLCQSKLRQQGACVLGSGDESLMIGTPEPLPRHLTIRVNCTFTGCSWNPNPMGKVYYRANSLNHRKRTLARTHCRSMLCIGGLNKVFGRFRLFLVSWFSEEGLLATERQAIGLEHSHTETTNMQKVITAAK